MKVFWCDLETGGLSPANHDITEFAAIVEIGGRVVEELEFLARPSDPSRVTPEALKVTGRSLDEVMAHPMTQAELHGRVLEVLGRHVDKYDRADKFTWAGQNPRFDMDFARALWDRRGDKYFGSWFWPNPADLIGLVMAARLRGHYSAMPNLRLVSIAEALGVEFRAHRAMDDIRTTRECFYRVSSLFAPANYTEAGSA